MLFEFHGPEPHSDLTRLRLGQESEQAAEIVIAPATRQACVVELHQRSELRQWLLAGGLHGQPQVFAHVF